MKCGNVTHPELHFSSSIVEGRAGYFVMAKLVEILIKRFSIERNGAASQFCMEVMSSGQNYFELKSFCNSLLFMKHLTYL